MNEISTFSLLGLSIFLHFLTFWLSRFTFFYYYSPFSILRFFNIFPKTMKFYRFYKHFCLSGDFLVAKRRRQRRLAHVHLEQGWLRFGPIQEVKKRVFFHTFFSHLSQKHQFLLSQIDYWMAPFWWHFFNYFHENSKMRLRGAPKILKKRQVL